MTWNGAGPNQAIASGAEGPGIYQFTPSLNLVPGQYSGVTATWTVGSTQVSNTYSISFNVLGSYTHTQYNTPAESQCSGSNAPAYLTAGPSACTWTPANMLSGFIPQAWQNGSGDSDINAHGYIKGYSGCAGPPGGSQNFFKTVTQVLPGCSSGNLDNSTVAVDIFSYNHPLQCNDQVLIVGSGGGAGTVKTVSDSCPACTGIPQIDDYSTSIACSLNSLGNYVTIRINR